MPFFSRIYPVAVLILHAVTLAVGSAGGDDVTCFSVYSQLNVNPLQAYPGNADSKAFGFATCKLCTDGAMQCTSLTHAGKSEIIAAHIHFVGDGEGKDGATGEGPPVINFCGKNGAGLVQDGVDYTRPCAQWDNNGVAHNEDMIGALVPGFNRGISAAERVADIVKHPHMYYLNFHTLASWTRWHPTPHGICRGKLELQGAVQAPASTTQAAARTTTSASLTTQTVAPPAAAVERPRFRGSKTTTRMAAMATMTTTSAGTTAWTTTPAATTVARPSLRGSSRGHFVLVLLLLAVILCWPCACFFSSAVRPWRRV